MNNATEIVPGVIFYSFLSEMVREKAWFVAHNTLVLQVSGQFKLSTTAQRISMNKGELMLVRKNQLVHLSKTPLPGEDYQTIVIFLIEDLLRTIALEEQVEPAGKYKGQPNVLVPANDFLQGYFQSVVPYVRNPPDKISASLGMLKVKEVVQLLLLTMPTLREFLFDFSEPHKIDLEQFMLKSFHYNVPVEKFAQLTGRSLAGFKRDFQKTFGMAPRQWLQEKRLNEALHLLEQKRKKSSEIYLDLGFESLSHFSHAFKKKFGKAPTQW